MTKSASTTDLQERLAIAERAITDAAARIDELSRTIGEIAQMPEGDESLRKAIAIGADGVSPFSLGFYEREYDVAGRAYRWTGRGNLFELRIRINRNFGWAFCLELQQNANVEIGRLRGYIDYIETPLEISNSDGIVRGLIPARPFGCQAVLTFLLPNLFVPKQMNSESGDTRTLGLVFYELRAVPSFFLGDGRSRTSDISSFVHQLAKKDGLLQKARSTLAGGARTKNIS